MRPSMAPGLICFLFGCAGISRSVAPPDVDAFPQEELSFQIAGDDGKVLRDIQDYLANRGWPAVVTVRAPKTFIVTTYVREPNKSSERRFRRTAFRLGLSQIRRTGTSPCTSVAVVSLTMSRGIHEELWSVQESDATFVSSAWPELKSLLEKEACR